MKSSDQNHWSSSNYAVTHVRNKDNNIQGRPPNVGKVIFHTIRNCSYRKEFAPYGSKFFPLKNSHYENGRNLRESLLDPVVSL